MTIIHFRFYHKELPLSDSRATFHISWLEAWEVSDEVLLGGCIPRSQEFRFSLCALSCDAVGGSGIAVRGAVQEAEAR